MGRGTRAIRLRFVYAVKQPLTVLSQSHDISIQSFRFAHRHRLGQDVDLLLQDQQPLLVVPQRIGQLVAPLLLPLDGGGMGFAIALLHDAFVKWHGGTTVYAAADPAVVIAADGMVVVVVGGHNVVLLLRGIGKHVRRHFGVPKSIGHQCGRRRRLLICRNTDHRLTRRGVWIPRTNAARTEDTALVRHRQLEILVRSPTRVEANAGVGDPAALATGRRTGGDVDGRLRRSRRLAQREIERGKALASASSTW